MIRITASLLFLAALTGQALGHLKPRTVTNANECPVKTTTVTFVPPCPTPYCPRTTSTVKVTVTVTVEAPPKTTICATPTPTITLTTTPNTSTYVPPTSTFGPLCPAYCVNTMYVALPIPCSAPTGPCTKPAPVTKTCDWCPTMSCKTFATKTVKWECPTATACADAKPTTVSCGYDKKPDGYEFQYS